MMTQSSSQLAKVSQRLLARVSKDILVSVKRAQSAFTYNYTIAALMHNKPFSLPFPSLPL